MIKITSVASDGMKAKSVVAMVAALAAGERDPRALADLAKGPLRARGMSSPRRWTACSTLPRGDRPDAAGPGRVPGPADHQDGRPGHRRLAEVPGSWGMDPPGKPAPAAVSARARRSWPPRTGWPRSRHQRVAGHRDHRRDRPEYGRPSPPRRTWCPGWGCPVRGQSGTRAGKGKPKGQQLRPRRRRAGRHWRRRTATFLGERYARIARRRGKAIAEAAVARSS